MKIAYTMSRFPKLTETFILYEIIEQERRGMDVSIYPLLCHSQTASHPEVQSLVQRAHYEPFLSASILWANWRCLRRSPHRYFATMFEALRGTVGSANFFIGAIGIFPKTVAFALQMQQERVRHLHAHFATHPALAALIVHRLTGIPFSFTAHGSDLHKDQRMLATKAETSEFVVSVSNFNKKFMVDRCGEHMRDKIRVIHCGVDTDYFRPRAGDRRPGPWRIVCVASFEEVKGHKYLIKACEKLRALGINFECHLIGDGPLRADVESRIAAARLDAEFHLHGPQRRPKVREKLWDSDVAVLASVPTSSGQREGIPVALMEAMACGVPVISSNMSGIPELVESGVSGLLLEPRDSEAIAAAMRRLNQSQELAHSLGRAARQKILDEFDLRNNASRLNELFRRNLVRIRRQRSGGACDT
jgi:glycosyltransferase involved in cell wall biosynthesis